jgi:hypothetical protein
MKFRFLNNKKISNGVIKHLETFKEIFDEENKIDVLWRLHYLSKIDEDLDEKESLFLLKIAECFLNGKLDKNEIELNLKTVNQFSDVNYNKDDIVYFRKIAKVLRNDQLIKLFSIVKEDNNLRLINFNKEQKDWLIISLFVLIYTDREVLMSEYNSIKKLVHKIEISSKDEEPMQKVEELMKNRYDILKDLHKFLC